MKTLLTIIFSWAWNIIKVLAVGLVLSLIWPDIKVETVVSIMALYTVIMFIRKAIKK